MRIANKVVASYISSVCERLQLVNVRTRVLTKFESPQLGSCKCRCAYINLDVGILVFSTFIQQIFLFFLFSFFCAHKQQKNANKRISDFFPLRWFLSAFFIFVRLQRFVLLFGCVFVLLVLLVRAKSFCKKKKKKSLKLP